MGHAGAIISSQSESAPEKVEYLTACGVTIVPTPSDFGVTVAELLAKIG
ncbi:MAG: hypothetical protein V3V31_09520 [Methylococcales bacterium]